MCDKCLIEPSSDGLPILKLGPWSEYKLFQLKSYAEAFTTSMRLKWPDRVFIDLFCGPGLCKVGEKSSEVVPGSPLVALRLKRPFSHYVFVDTDMYHLKALEIRAELAKTNSQIKTVHGDCNDKAVLADVLEFIPKGALCLLFADPFRWNLRFATLQSLLTSRRTDVIVVVQIGSMKRAIKDAPTSMNEFFGDNGEWLQRFEAAKYHERTRTLLDYYKQRLSTLGYLQDKYPTDVPVLNSKNVPLYYLVFASKHPLGQDLWRKTIQRTKDGIRRLPGF